MCTIKIYILLTFFLNLITYLKSCTTNTNRTRSQWACLWYSKPENKSETPTQLRGLHPVSKKMQPQAMCNSGSEKNSYAKLISHLIKPLFHFAWHIGKELV